MTASQNRKPPLDELSQSSFSYEFDQMLYILGRLNIVRGQQTSPIHINTHVHLNWPPGDIYRISIGQKKNEPHKVDVNFFGLAGAQGPLPITVTELLLKRLRQGDTAFKAFLDIFNNRLLHLLHHGHQKLNPLADLRPPQQTTLGKTLLSLAGIAGASLENRCAFPDRALLAYAGILWLTPRNPKGLKQILTHYFQKRVHPFQMRGRWMNFLPLDQTQIGTKNQRKNILGVTAALGSRAWDEMHYVIIPMGPLLLKEYLNFLPTGQDFLALKDLCQFYIHQRARTIIQLHIQPEQIQWAKLNGTFQLGWTTWLKGKSQKSQDYQTQLIL